MTTVNQLAEHIVTALAAEISEIDAWSAIGYEPMIETRTACVVTSPFGHADTGMVYSAGWMHVIHSFVVEFYVKYIPGTTDSLVLIQNIGYMAMRALVKNDVTGGYTLASGSQIGALTYRVSNDPLDVGGQPFLQGQLIVPVMQKESV